MLLVFGSTKMPRRRRSRLAANNVSTASLPAISLTT
jgi:hypothetical protein